MEESEMERTKLAPAGAGTRDRWISTAAVARLLGLKPRTVRQLAARGVLPSACKPGLKDWKFWSAAIHAYIQQRRQSGGLE
jgi:excisionase family DNA binding protein